MAIDLSDYTDSLKREVNPPGSTTFPNATDDEFFGYLEDAFWEVRLDGMLKGFTESDGLISSQTGGDDLTRDLVQLIVLYAGMRIIRNQITNTNSSFHAVAGPVEFEVETSSQQLQAVLAELKFKRDLVLRRLSDVGTVPDYYIDTIVERDFAFDRYWGQDPFSPYWVR